MKVSAAEQIARDLISRILSGELKPGDRLPEQQLARDYKTSRGPVREALRILDGQFFVAHERDKGARVARVNFDSHPGDLAVAAVLQGLAARLCATQADVTELQEIDRLAGGIAEAALSGESSVEFAQRTWELGGYIMAAARNARLEEFAAVFQNAALVQLSLQGLSTRQDRIDAARCWVDVSIAIRLRDGDGAEIAWRRLAERSLRAALRHQIQPDLWIEPEP